MAKQANGVERKQYRTKQQEAVLALFSGSNSGCLTVEEAYGRLSASGMPIGKTTVYRAIARLCQRGVLRRYAPQDNAEAAYYQLNTCGGSHLHMRCVACGQLAHLDCEEASGFFRHIASHHGFALDEQQTVLYGRCKGCMEQEDTGNVQCPTAKEIKEQSKENPV